MNLPSDPIGVFDSGVGGLTVTRALVDRLPGEAILYLGDTARVPYGNKAPATIERYGLNIARRLNDTGIKALVIACNTASAFALEAIVKAHPKLPVLGVIEPVAQQAAASTRSGVVGVIGTRGTVASGAYTRALHEANKDLQIISHPCPLFVPLAEEGWLDGAVPTEVARTYLAPFAGTGIDTLILGCTHYPLLRPVIQRVINEVVGRQVEVLDTATATAKVLDDLLRAQALQAPRDSPAPAHKFWVTDAADSFKGVSTRFFGSPLGHIEHVDL